MRCVLHGDLVAAARVLLALPPERRRAAMRLLLARARAADRYRLRHGRAHPRFGTGSLMAAASGWERLPEPALSDPDYLRCLIVVLSALLENSGRQPPPA